MPNSISNNDLQTSNSCIYLLGMMGVGKSTKGKKIAQLLGFSFIDLDKEIERVENKKITEIFEKHGEEYFRNAESQTLRSIKKDHIVIATGGGTPCYNNNMQYIKSTGISIYLKAKPGLIFHRISAEPDKRPLLKGMDKEQIRTFIEEKISERESTYLLSDHVFEIPETSAETIVKSIL